MQRTRGQAVLSRQRMIGQLNRSAAPDDQLVKPIPAGSGQLEIHDEIENHSFADHFLETRIEIDIEVGRQHVAIVARLKLGITQADVSGDSTADAKQQDDG